MTDHNFFAFDRRRPRSSAALTGTGLIGNVTGRPLAFFGRNGPTLLVASLIIGALAPTLAHSARALLPASAFLLTLGSFLSAMMSPGESGRSRSRLLIILAWSALAVPALVAVLLGILRVGADLRTGVIVSVVAPPVGSAAAIATMLGLRPRLALLCSIVLTLASPLLMPLLAGFLASDVSFDGGRLAMRLAWIVGGAALIAALSKRFGASLTYVLPNPQAAAGVAVVGLILVGLATADGVKGQFVANPRAFELFLLGAIALNIGIGVVTAILFLGMGLKDAMTVALVSGNRNVTLAWAAGGATLTQSQEAWVAASVVPILSLPLAIKGLFALRGVYERAGLSFNPAPGSTFFGGRRGRQPPPLSTKNIHQPRE